MGQKKRRTQKRREACLFCGNDEDNEIVYGKLHQNEEFSIHQNCMFLSSGLAQQGSQEEGILGFLTEDIKEEYSRGQKLRCCYCKKDGATLGCVVNNCKKSFHYPCGVKNRALNQHFGDFSSYCHSHKLKQKSIRINKESYCHICCTKLSKSDLEYCLYSPCCKNNWFHRDCLQKYAINAGLHFFKCPLCNNSSTFVEEMKIYGIYIPDKDASWELEFNAFNELLYRPECGASECACQRGRKHNGKGAWSLLVCAVCGADARHKQCGNVHKSRDRWKCKDCKAFEVERKKKEAAKLTCSNVHENDQLLCDRSSLIANSNKGDKAAISTDVYIDVCDDEATMSADENIDVCDDETTMSANENDVCDDESTTSFQNFKFCNKKAVKANESKNMTPTVSMDKNFKIGGNEKTSMTAVENIETNNETSMSNDKNIKINNDETDSYLKLKESLTRKYKLRSLSIVLIDEFRKKEAAESFHSSSLESSEIPAEKFISIKHKPNKKRHKSNSSTKSISDVKKNKSSFASFSNTVLNNDGTSCKYVAKDNNASLVPKNNELHNKNLAILKINESSSVCDLVKCIKSPIDKGKLPLHNTSKADICIKESSLPHDKNLKENLTLDNSKIYKEKQKKNTCLKDRNEIQGNEDYKSMSSISNKLSVKRQAPKSTNSAKLKRRKTVGIGCCSSTSNHCIKKMFGISCENCG